MGTMKSRKSKENQIISDKTKEKRTNVQRTANKTKVFMIKKKGITHKSAVNSYSDEQFWQILNR